MTIVMELTKISAIVVVALLMRTVMAPAAPLAQTAIEAPIEQPAGVAMDAIAPADWTPAALDSALAIDASGDQTATCGARRIRVYDPFIGDYAWRDARVCALTLP